MRGKQKYKKLVIWQKAISLVKAVYDVTKAFPKEEQYALASQLQRAAVSVPSNIAEGAGRQGDKEFVQFLYIAKASLAEIETQLIIAEQLGYLKDDKLESLSSLIEEVDNGAYGLIAKLKGEK